MNKKTMTQENTQNQKALKPYTPPTIESEPLFENNALESAGKSGDNTFDPGHPCFGFPEQGS